MIVQFIRHHFPVDLIFHAAVIDLNGEVTALVESAQERARARGLGHVGRGSPLRRKGNVPSEFRVGWIRSSVSRNSVFPYLLLNHTHILLKSRRIDLLGFRNPLIHADVSGSFQQKVSRTFLRTSLQMRKRGDIYLRLIH